MNIDQQEPPLPHTSKQSKGKNDARKLGAKNKPAISGLKYFGEIFHRIERSIAESRFFIKNKNFLEPRAIYFSREAKRLYYSFAKVNGLNKTLAYRIGLLVALAMIPLISEAAVSQQAYSDLMRYSEPLDPIEAGQFERNLSQYSSKGFYIDPEKIILAEMEKNSETMTLEQQLQINAGKNIEAPSRQAPTYTLQNGETITQVANKFDLHVGTILDANNLQPEDLKKIKSGIVLDIPSSDTNTTDNWLVAINQAEEKVRQDALAKQQAAAAAKKKATQTSSTRLATGGVFSYTQRGRGGSSNVTVIGYSNEQCLPWAREQTGIQVHGYAGNVAPTQSEPIVGGLALDRFYGHVSVVVSVSSDYIVVHEANYISGRVTERTVSKDAIRGYVY